jgi:hypothetical protein
VPDNVSQLSRVQRESLVPDLRPGRSPRRRQQSGSFWMPRSMHQCSDLLSATGSTGGSGSARVEQPTWHISKVDPLQ